MKSNIKQKIQAVIFDLDGTLIDYEGISNAAMSYPFEKYSESVSWERQAKLIGTPIAIWGRELINEKNLTDKIELDDYKNAYFQYIRENFSEMKPLPGVIELIGKLHKLKIPMAIATTTERINFDEKMIFHRDILDKMNEIVTGDEVINGKPAPDIFLLAPKKLGKDPTKCLVFEDSPAEIQGAIAAGCYAVAIPDPRMIEFNNSKFLIANEVVNSLLDFNLEKFEKEE